MHFAEILLQAERSAKFEKLNEKKRQFIKKKKSQSINYSSNYQVAISHTHESLDQRLFPIYRWKLNVAHVDTEI